MQANRSHRALSPRAGTRPAPLAQMRGVTLIELLVVVAVAVILLGLAAPSFSEYIVTQRVRSIHAQLVTDLQYARSEAVSRGSFVSVRFQRSATAPARSCYVIYTRPNPAVASPNCDCLQPEGSRCAANPTTTSEIRTVVVEDGSGVRVQTPVGQTGTLTYDPRAGAMYVNPADVSILVQPNFSVDAFADNARRLRASVQGSGRPLVCAPSGSRLGGTTCS